MARFKLNRQWAFILALGASLVCSSIVSHEVAAQTGSNLDDPTNPGYTPPSAGDPDSPSGPGAKMNRPGVAVRTSSNLGRRPVGDGRTSRGAWLFRLNVAWLSLRGYLFRF